MLAKDEDPEAHEFHYAVYKYTRLGSRKSPDDYAEVFDAEEIQEFETRFQAERESEVPNAS